MRRIRSTRAACCILLLLLIALALPLKGSASTTTLTIHLPKYHTIDLKIRGTGSVYLGDSLYTQSATVELPRLSTLQIQVVPGKNGYLHSLVLNGETQPLHSGQYTLDISALTEDITLEIRFRTHSIIPDTGDTILIPACLMLLSGTILALVIKRKRPS